jgi:hypothetical protein
MNDIPPARLWIGYVVMFGLPLLAILFRRTWWGRLLHAKAGPELDVTFQTRRDCFRNAATFAVLGVAGILAAFGTGWLADRFFGAVDAVPAVMGLMFVYMILGLVGFGGAIYLLIRAPFRPASLPAIDPARDLYFLKEYETVDRSRLVFVAHNTDMAYFVIVREVTDEEIEKCPPPVVHGPFALLATAEDRALVESGHKARTGV